jgi:hypothetical protein
MPVKKAITILALALLLATLSGVSGCEGTVIGSGETVTWEMSFTDFNRLEISQAFEVNVNRADDFRVSITIDEMLYEYLEIDQRGDTLRIGLKSRYSYVDTVQQATIELPDLRRLELSGASRAVVSGFSVSHSLDFELSGASWLDLGHTIAGNSDFSLSGASHVNGVIEMDDGDFNLSGASFLELKGSADDITIDVSGASRVNLSEFVVPTADINLSGASYAVVNVSTCMGVNLSGASNLEYIGKPTLDKLEMSGGSTINKRE